MLLGLGAVAHWQLTTGRGRSLLRRRVADVTQCILTVGDGTVRIAKAEGRPPSVEGLVFRYRDEGRSVALEPAPAAAVLGTGLRTLRQERRLSQSEVAGLAGVSASAISQAERGERGLSLNTLLELTGRLGISIDQLLLTDGNEERGYRIARRDDPRHGTFDRPVALFDDPHDGVRVYVLRLTPGGRALPEFTHKGVEIVAVAQGLVQVTLETGTPRPPSRRGPHRRADRRQGLAEPLRPPRTRFLDPARCLEARTDRRSRRSRRGRSRTRPARARSPASAASRHRAARASRHPCTRARHGSER